MSAAGSRRPRCDGLDLSVGCAAFEDSAADPLTVSGLPGSAIADLRGGVEEGRADAAAAARKGLQSNWAVAGAGCNVDVSASSGGYCRHNEPRRISPPEHLG